MGIAGDTESTHYEPFRAQAHSFDRNPERLGLGEAQIAAQTEAELEDSLARIDDALRAPDSFGILRLKVSAKGVAVIAASIPKRISKWSCATTSERKKAIKDRLRAVRSNRPINTISELI